MIITGRHIAIFVLDTFAGNLGKNWDYDETLTRENYLSTQLRENKNCLKLFCRGLAQLVHGYEKYRYSQKLPATYGSIPWGMHL